MTPNARWCRVIYNSDMKCIGNQQKLSNKREGERDVVHYPSALPRWWTQLYCILALMSRYWLVMPVTLWIYYWVSEYFHLPTSKGDGNGQSLLFPQYMVWFYDRASRVLCVVDLVSTELQSPHRSFPSVSHLSFPLRHHSFLPPNLSFRPTSLPVF